MKRFACLIVAMVWVGAASVALAESEALPTVALVVAETPDRADPSHWLALEASLFDAMSHDDAITLVERQELESILDELRLSLYGRVDAATMQRLGKLTQVDVFVLVDAVAPRPFAAEQTSSLPPLARVRTVEARTGIILSQHVGDIRTLVADVSPARATISSGLRWHRTPDDDRAFVAMLGFDSEELGPTLVDKARQLQDAFEATLISGGEAIVLQRTDLARLTQEEVLAGGKVTLRESTVLILGGLRRADRDYVISTRLIPLNGAKAVDKNWTLKDDAPLAALLTTMSRTVASAIEAMEPVEGADVSSEAAELRRRADLLGARGEMIREIQVTQALVALDPSIENLSRLTTALWRPLCYGGPYSPWITSQPNWFLNDDLYQAALNILEAEDLLFAKAIDQGVEINFDVPLVWSPTPQLRRDEFLPYTSTRQLDPPEGAAARERFDRLMTLTSRNRQIKKEYRALLASFLDPMMRQYVRAVESADSAEVACRKVLEAMEVYALPNCPQGDQTALGMLVNLTAQCVLIEETFAPGAADPIWKWADSRPEVPFKAIRLFRQMLHGDEAQQAAALETIQTIAGNEDYPLFARMSLLVFLNAQGRGRGLTLPASDVDWYQRHDEAMARIHGATYPTQFRMLFRMTEGDHRQFFQTMASRIRYESDMVKYLAKDGQLAPLYEEVLASMVDRKEPGRLAEKEGVMRSIRRLLPEEAKASVKGQLTRLAEMPSLSAEYRLAVANAAARIVCQLDDPMRFVWRPQADTSNDPANPWNRYGIQRVAIKPSEPLGSGRWDELTSVGDWLLACWDSDAWFNLGVIDVAKGEFDIWKSIRAPNRARMPWAERDFCLAQLGDVLFAGRGYPTEQIVGYPDFVDENWPAFFAIRKPPAASKGYGESAGLPGRAVSGIVVHDGQVYLIVERQGLREIRDAHGNLVTGTRRRSSSLVRFDPSTETFELLLSYRRVGTDSPLQGTEPYVMTSLMADAARNCLYFNVISVGRKSKNGAWRYNLADGAVKKMSDSWFLTRYDDDHVVTHWPMAINLDSHADVSLNEGDGPKMGTPTKYVVLNYPHYWAIRERSVDTADRRYYRGDVGECLDGYFFGGVSGDGAGDTPITIFERDSQRAWMWNATMSGACVAEPWEGLLIFSTGRLIDLYRVVRSEEVVADDGVKVISLERANRDYEKVTPPPAEPVRLFMQAGRFGILHRDKGVIVPAKYAFYRGGSQAGAFAWGRAALSTFQGGSPDYAGYTHMVNASGQQLHSQPFAQVLPATEGLSPVQGQEPCPGDHDDMRFHLLQWGFADAEGKLVIPARYDGVEPFSNGRAAVVKDTYGWRMKPHGVEFFGGKWGFIDRSGRVIKETIYNEVLPYSEGLASVNILGKGWGVIDLNGNYVVDHQYGKIRAFHDNVAWATRAFKLWSWDVPWILIDASGREISRPIRGRIGDFSDQRAWIKAKGETYWVAIDPTGKVVIDDRITDAFPFRNGVARVKTDAAMSPTGKPLFGCLDVNGQWVIKPQFADLGVFQEGFAQAKPAAEAESSADKDELWGYVDREGEWVFPPQFDQVEPFSSGMARVVKDGHVLYIDTAGKVLLDVGPLWHERGLIVVTVSPDTPASRGGLKPDDVILRIGDRDAAHYDQLETVDYEVGRTYYVYRQGEVFTFDCPPGMAGFTATSFLDSKAGDPINSQAPPAPATPKIIIR